MIIAYYRNTEGQIVSFHTVKGMSMERATKEAENYNKRSTAITTATVIEVEEDSLEAYLVERAQRPLKIMKSFKDETISALQEAINCIAGLEVVER